MGKKKNKKVLEQYHHGIRTYREKASDLFERQLVYISGGAIALCLGLLQSEDTYIYEGNMLAFKWALGGFIFTLLLNLVSHQTSIKSMDSELDGEDCKSQNWDKATSYINYASMLTLVIGLVSIFITVIQIQ